MVIDPWMQPDPGYTNARIQVRTGSFPEKVNALKEFFSGDDRRDIGGFELWICASCGYSEFYAKDTAELLKAADEGVEGIRRVGPPDTTGEYR